MATSSKSRIKQDVNDKITLLSQIAARPELKEILDEIAAAPVERRLDVARAVATTTALAKRGVKIPKGLRLTTRYFEEPAGDGVALTGAVTLEGNPVALASAGTLCLSIGAGVVVNVCLSYGSEVSLTA